MNDWQSWAALTVVAVTAVIFVMRIATKKKKPGGGCGSGCGCGPVKTAGTPSKSE